jgi:flagellar basal-body rod protein FlgB
MNPVSANLSTLQQFLKLTTTREQAIASNMANVDTPGYRTRDVNFQAEMRKATESGSGMLLNSSFESGQSAATSEVHGLMERPDGNNVNLDREGLLMSETQLQYQLGVQLVKHQFHSLLSAINGGS